MAGIYQGPLSWIFSTDDEGHRDYRLTSQVKCTRGDGPLTIYTTPGLPAIGSIWSYGGDIDAWAFCTPKVEVDLYKHEEGKDGAWNLYKVTNHFSSKPKGKRCQDTTIDDPLMEAPTISGDFSLQSKVARYDKDGYLLMSSSLEPIEGPEAEFDEVSPGVQIGINYLTISLYALSQAINTVNASPLWGLPARCIRLVGAPWERKLYGRCCYYYTVNYKFQASVAYDKGGNVMSGWDREILDIGTKALSGYLDKNTGAWVTVNVAGSAPDPTNPNHFVDYTDLNGKHTKVWLNGAGIPVDTMDDAGTWIFKKYHESNFLSLGIPTAW